MSKYMVRLKENYKDEVEAELKKEEIEITYITKLIPNFVIVETNKSLKELRINPLIKSVEEERIGHLCI